MISYYKSNQCEFGYNVENGGNATGKMSVETRQKISIANKGRVSPNKGKQMSDEQKKKMSDAAQGKYVGEKNPRARKVVRLSDLKLYGYITEAAQDNGVTRDTMRKRCKKHQDFMFYDEYLAQQND